ncbi:MAG: glycine--tRNA ligase subunit beta [Terriglobia bacterium]
MSGEFLLEIGCEEIPARLLRGAAASLEKLLGGALRERGLLQAEGKVEMYFTPRRLAAHCRELAAKEPDREQRALGPPKSVAFDEGGKPTRAAESFARKQSIAVGRLKLVETPRGSYVAAITRQKGRATSAVLAQLLPELIPRIRFPRSMYWTSPRGLRFIRPIRWVLALWAGRVVKFELEGVRSGNLTWGHRLMSHSAIRVGSFSEYRRRLRRAGVLIDVEERREKILRESRGLLKAGGLRRHADNELLETVVNLVEHPTVLRGEFDPQFMALPREVLVTVMRHHQKYFSVVDRRGKLVASFLAVIDLDRDRGGRIRRGHEAVLAARFRDAEFFRRADGKRSLEERLLLLEEVVYESRLGSYRRKLERVSRLSAWLGKNVAGNGRRADIDALLRAARLSKSDLTTDMVGEFPELQGVVGGLYARAQGESETVARAIAEHYKPVGPEDDVPATLEGALLSLADKLDRVVGCFAVGHEPTGSRDPFALRRAAGGAVRVIVEGGLRVSLSAALEQALAVLRDSGIEAGEGVAERAAKFIEDRARHLFRDGRGHRYDEVNAAFAAGWDDLVDAAARLEALRRLRPTANFEPVAVAFKRIRNILAQAGDGPARARSPVDEALLEPGPERDLYQRLCTLGPRVAELRAGHRYPEALREIASLRPQVDRFFDKVLVMAKEERVRENRLRLLAHLLEEFSSVADFSEIVVNPKRKE